MLRVLQFVFVLICFCSRLQADSLLRGVTLAAEINTSDIDELVEWKPNLVRYHLIWYQTVDSASAAEYTAWLDSALDRFDTFLPLFESYGMKVVLTLGSPPGGISDYSSPAQGRVFLEQWAQDLFVSSWEKMALRYKDSSVIWGYDLMNEPAQRRVTAGLKNWVQLAAATTTAIRAIDTQHKIIYEPPYGDIGSIKKLASLTSLSNSVFSPHMYYPWRFIHQGLYGVPIGIRYPNPKKGMDRATVLRNLRPVMSFKKKYKAEIYIGEFTVARWAPNGSGYRYLRDLINIFETQKWHWTYHVYKGVDVWSVEHDSIPSHHEKAASMPDRQRLLRSKFEKNT